MPNYKALFYRLLRAQLKCISFLQQTHFEVEKSCTTQPEMEEINSETMPSDSSINMSDTFY